MPRLARAELDQKTLRLGPGWFAWPYSRPESSWLSNGATAWQVTNRHLIYDDIPGTAQPMLTLSGGLASYSRPHSFDTPYYPSTVGAAPTSLAHHKDDC